MKRTMITGLIVMMFASYAWALTDADGVKLSGKHYNLQIIGVQNKKTADMDSDTGNGGVIFVNMEGKTKIGLVESGSADAPEVDPEDFAVLDKNGTDGDGALLALPDPDLDPYIVGQDMTDVDTQSAYSVFVRPLGKPLGFTTITTCADIVESELADFLGKDDFAVVNEAGAFGGKASIEQVGKDITFRDKGKTTFTNVTAELLTIVLKINILDEDDNVIDTVYARIPIFDDILAGEYWEYDQGDPGLKHLQVRFYPISTDVSAGDGDLPAL